MRTSASPWNGERYAASRDSLIQTQKGEFGIKIYPGSHLNAFLQRVGVKIDETRRNIVVSRRSLIEKQRQEAREVLLEHLEEGQLRLLTVDEEVVLPVDTNIRILLASDDVIHNWAVPSFGVKMDAVPGRVLRTWFRAEKTGIYYGQCSELCGVKHAFMPIAVRVVTQSEYDAWLEKAKEEFASRSPAPPMDGDGDDRLFATPKVVAMACFFLFPLAISLPAALLHQQAEKRHQGYKKLEAEYQGRRNGAIDRHRVQS